MAAALFSSPVTQNSSVTFFDMTTQVGGDPPNTEIPVCMVVFNIAS